MPINNDLPSNLELSDDYNDILSLEISYTQAKFWLDSPIYGLYWIECKQTKRVYIGQSGNIRIRWKNHRAMLQRQIHPCKQLQTDFNKFGHSNLCFYRVLGFGVSPNKSQRLKCEQALINCIPENQRYNKQKNGPNNPFWQKSLSTSARYLISKQKQNKPSGFKNHTHSEEVKATISEQNKGMSSSERSKPVFVNHVFYTSISDASRATGYARKTIRKKANTGLDPNVYWVNK